MQINSLQITSQQRISLRNSVQPSRLDKSAQAPARVDNKNIETAKHVNNLVKGERRPQAKSASYNYAYSDAPGYRNEQVGSSRAYRSGNSASYEQHTSNKSVQAYLDNDEFNRKQQMSAMFGVDLYV